MPHGVLINLYGSSEVSADVTGYDTRRFAKGFSIVPIGRPIINSEVYLLDRRQNPVPVGVPGELHVGGVGLARGYLNRPELTAEKFVTNPFSDKQGARLYKTGDLARYMPDGNLEFLGRMDHQIKIRGFRIELGEIESVLCQHPAVRESVVLAREDRPGDTRLVAYVVPGEEPAPPVSELGSFLKGKLPDYMVPSAFVMLSALPLTPNGKLDRRALPAPSDARPDLEAGFLAPRDDFELQMTRIWEKVLGVHPIGVRDDFFELGGHSFLAVRLFTEVEKSFGKNLPLAILFQAPTIAQLAGILREKNWLPSWSSLVVIQEKGDGLPLFCVPGLGGNILRFRDLSRHLGPDQPVYALQAQGLDGKQKPFARVEDMATHYIREIRRVQPEGPYFFAGASFGGKVVFEMARQLDALGQKVALVALFDSFAPGSFDSLPTRAVIRNYMSNYMSKYQVYVLSYLALLRGDPWRYIPRIPSAIARRIIYKAYPELEKPLPRAIRTVREASASVERKYLPQVYRGRVTLFRAGTRWGPDVPDYEMGWGKLAAGGVEIWEVPGSHSNIYTEPSIRVLANQLRDCLARANAATKTPAPLRVIA